MRIVKSHALGAGEVKERVNRLAGDLERRYGVSSAWDGNDLALSGSGIDGRLRVADDSVELDLRLGFALRLMESRIREAVTEAMERHLAG